MYLLTHWKIINQSGIYITKSPVQEFLQWIGFKNATSQMIHILNSDFSGTHSPEKYTAWNVSVATPIRPATPPETHD